MAIDQRMFGFFKKKNPIDRLQTKYELLVKEAYRLSTVDRSASDSKYAEADSVSQEIERLKNNLET